MTETITHIAVKKLNNFSVISSTVEKSFYKTLPNIKLLADSRGCLIIDAPEICEEKIVTNDVVNIVSSTQFEWLGRFDTIINSGGIKLIPEQIEIKLSEIISERFFVAGIRDAVLGEKLILLVESEPQEKFLQRIKQLNSLSKYEFPKEIYFLQAFILTDTQKINRPRTLDLLVLN
jgi:O-succinylbenzoic acid--CoA ligase